MPETTDPKAVLDLLETAHGYAVIGHIMPMRHAALDCGVARGSAVWNEADRLVRGELPALSPGSKPSIDQYETALARAVAKAADHA